MSSYFCNLRLTRAYNGWLMHKIFGSIFSYVIYGILLLPFVLIAIETKEYQTLSFVAGIIFFGLHVESVFMNEHVNKKNTKPVNPANIACYLSYDLLKNIKFKNYISSEKLFKAAVHSKKSIFVLQLLGITKKEILMRIKNTNNENAIILLQDALNNAQKLGLKYITAPVLLRTFFERGGEFEKILNECNMSLKNFKEIVKWEIIFEDAYKKIGPLHPDRLVQSLGPMGRSWVQGYTNELDAIADELSGKVVWRYKQRKIILHAKEIESALQIITRSGGQNIVLVGEQESGKESMMENICATLRMNEMEKGTQLTRILSLKTHTLLSGFKNPDKVLLRALERAEKSGKFILVIKDFAGFLKSADANVRIVLARFLQSSSLCVIGITTPDEYHRFLKSEPAIDNQCEKIYLNDTSREDTMAVLIATHLASQGKGKKVKSTYRVLETVLRLSERYVGNSKMPGSAVRVLQDAKIAAKREGAFTLTENHVRKAISLQAHMDVSEISDDEKLKLKGLEEILRKSVVGQDEALSALVNALKRARMDISAGKRPLGTFLFLGPTGVGKTYSAKIVAKEYFGDEEALIRIDMNDFSTENSVYGIIGDPNPGSLNAGYVTKRIQEKPFSLLLLDEIEKAHTSVLNVFLQILDEGHLTDNRGVKTDFRNTIIIATSNAGAHFIRDFMKSGQKNKKEEFKNALIESIIKDRIFSPEFVNRFDEIILYTPLNIRNAIKVALLLLDDIVKDIAEKKGYALKIEEDAIVEIVKNGYSLEFGAREMRRIITHSIETFLADTMIGRDVKRGEVIRIGVADIKKYLGNKA